ncbi:MAG: elongation factor G [Chloroflexia bacterium]|nr:elongation factor G [Chloroflexia bacterium]
MKQYPAERIRNVGLFSHGGAGKTSLVEALAFDTKTIQRLGRVEDGTTISDFDPDEIKRHISVSGAVIPIEWNDTKINLLDPPGYADFLGEVKSALRVVDAAIVVLDASAGVEVGTEQAWRRCEEQQLPRLIFINKMDRENADFRQTLDSARTAFGKQVAPLQFPIGSEKSFKGIVDLLSEQAYTFHDNHDGGYETGPIPVDLDDDCRTYRQQIVEAIAEHDEELMVRYLEDDPISNEELHAGLQACLADGTVIPVFCGAATSNRGMQPLLDAIVEYLPAASSRSERGMSNGVEVEVHPDPAAHLAAFAFKTLADPHVGRVTYLRVFSGTFKSNSHVLNATKAKPERIGQVFYIRGKEHLPAADIGSGDIGAVSKLATVATGDTLSDETKPIELAKIDFPAAAYAAAVNPKTKADLDKMGQALTRLTEEDPTLQVSRDPATGEMIVAGLGEPHVQIALERMTRRFGVNVELGLPRVAYRETISAKTLAEYKHKKQTGGAGQYGHVFLQLEPLEEGEFEFVDRVVGGSVPKNFFPAVEKGVREALESGPLAGYPVVRIRVTLTDGSYHDVDSNEMAFKIAAKEAFKKGVLQAKPALLEPIMTLRVGVPESHLGDVMSDLNTKRAHVSGMTPQDDGLTLIEATVPAAEIQRYATDLRSITQGRGHFTKVFSHYQQVPAHLSEQICAAAHQRETAHA